MESLMKAAKYGDLIKLCASVALLTVATAVIWSGPGATTVEAEETAPRWHSKASKRGRILRQDRQLRPPRADFLDYEISRRPNQGAGADTT